MYSINDTVLYGADGVCQIAGLTEKNVGGSSREYYVLKPVYSESTTIFAPVNSAALNSKMRRVLSEREIHRLIGTMPGEKTIWIDDESARRTRYKEILAGGDRKELIRLIKTLYLRGQAQKEQGRKLHMTDERFMKEAEKMLYEEFAHVLKMQREEVLTFIMEQIEPE